jgi:hypothetical protein
MFEHRNSSIRIGKCVFVLPGLITCASVRKDSDAKARLWGKGGLEQNKTQKIGWWYREKGNDGMCTHHPQLGLSPC